MKKALTGIGSLIILLALLVGVPAALVFFAGNPFPSWDEVVDAVTGPDWAGHFLITTILPLIAWVAWGTFAVSAVAEIPSQVRGIPAPSLPGLSIQQKTVGALIGAVIVLFASSTVLPSTTASAAPAVAESAISTTLAEESARFTTVVDELQQQQDEDAGQQDEEDQEEKPTYTVHDGDSLWRIAEKTLGAGERFTEIAQLNYGVEQDDGYALSADQWLNPGWVLTLPDDADTGDSESDDSDKHTVSEGETMWDIAEDAYDDGTRYTDIYEASKETDQPTGRTITDPDLILPGEVLTVPSDSTTEPDPEPASTSKDESSHTPDDDTVKSPATAAPTHPGHTAQQEDSLAGDTDRGESSPSFSEQTDTEDATSVDELDEIFNVRTTGGIGAIMAAGILSVLGIRRLKQRRKRKAGQRISMPDDTASTVELELRAVENPMGMADIDHALKYLSSWAQHQGNQELPRLLAVRLADAEIALYLEESHQLPDPFVAVADDDTAWTIAPDKLPNLEHVPSSPYPALVTLGQDPQNAHILVDLENVGALNIHASPGLANGALTALAVELATSEWSDDLQITLVGTAEGLPHALDTGRVRHVDDIDVLIKNLEGDARSVEKAMQDLGVDTIEQARSMNPDAQAWAPEIVILSELPTPQQQEEIASIVRRVPRVGVAAISNGQLTGDWALNIDSDNQASLVLPGGRGELPLTPQIVSDEEYDRIVSLLESSEKPGEPGPDWAQGAQRAEVDLDDIAEPPAGEEAPAPIQEEEPTSEPSEKNGVARNVPPPEVSIDGAPYVQLLGPVMVVGARGDEPRTSTGSTIVRTTEFVSFLALNPGASTDDVHAALWPGKDPSGKTAASSRNGQASKARKWLGNADDGAPFFPPVTPATGYQLHETIRTDWDLFVVLIGSDVSKTSTTDLVAALQLVKGQPISGVKDRYYGWAERIRQEMIASIGDASHELVQRSLRTGDTAHARFAAAIGRQIDPINELYWRDALMAEHQAGDRDGFDRIVNQLGHHLESFDDGYEPEPETQDLIDRSRLQTQK